MKNTQEKINKVFVDNFGRTPLQERLNDIMGITLKLIRFTDIPNLQDKTGDLLSSILQLCNENQWDSEELINNTLQKISRRTMQYKSLGRTIKVGIIGGAFDPVTNGHIKLAKFVLDSSKTFDEIWLLPCYQHMYNKKMESVEHRINMCKIATQSDKRIQVCDYEAKNQLRGETYHLVKKLTEEYANTEYEFSMIIGLDNANTFDKWVNYELLEKMIRFVVVPRKGVTRDLNVTWYLKPPHIYLTPDNDIPNISSTIVRENIEILRKCVVEEDIIKNYHYDAPLDTVERFIEENIPEGVFPYIIEHDLYNSNNKGEINK